MIQVQDLVKDYGNIRAVSHINFQVPEGQILGFLGPNGAGKSTTLKLLTGYLLPTAGTITVDDLDIWKDSRKIRRMIGYLPENNPLYHDMTVHAFLDFVSEVRNIPVDGKQANIRRVVEKCGLVNVVGQRIGTLSKGYRQRVGLAQAILHDPKILVLDEPTSGLDPNQIIEIRELIKELGRNKTLIISTHILQEVQAVCDRIVIINKGVIAGNGTMDELRSSFQGKSRLKLELVAPKDEIPSLLGMVEGLELVSIQPAEGSAIEVHIDYASDSDKRPDIYRFIRNREWVLLGMERENISLEHVFRNLTLEDPAVAPAKRKPKKGGPVVEEPSSDEAEGGMIQ